ncbi:MAG: GNAT family N-acetyltransferase [Dehalococcoidales bacterium]|jgi:ribosomal protein S18 acetylase RimI-like enzyme
MAVKIHPMRAADKPALMKILENTPEFKPFEVVVAEELIDYYLSDEVKSGYNILIAEDEGEVAGYVCYGETPCTVGTWDLYWIAVDRSRRGKGIGKLLTADVEAAVRKRHGRLVFIETSSMPLYENTRQFYLARGYEVVARIPDFYMPGDDKIILQKRM